MRKIGAQKMLDLPEGDLLFVASQIFHGNIQLLCDSYQDVHAGLPASVDVSGHGGFIHAAHAGQFALGQALFRQYAGKTFIKIHMHTSLPEIIAWLGTLSSIRSPEHVSFDVIFYVRYRSG